MTSAHTILVERQAKGWHVRVRPALNDGTECDGTFREYEDARLFAAQLKRARGWSIFDPFNERLARFAPLDASR